MYFYASEPKDNIIKQVATVIQAMTPKWGYDVEVKEHKPKRTNAQNNFYWLNNEDVAKFLNESGMTVAFGLPLTSETIHEINKKYIGVMTTTKLSLQEFCEYMTKMFGFWIEKTGGQWQPKESPYGYLEKTGLVEKELA